MITTDELKRMPTGRLVDLYAHRRDHGVSAEWGVVCDELNRRLLLVGTAVAVDGNHLVAGDPYHNRHGSFPVTIGVAPPEDVDRALRNRGEAIDAPPAPGPQEENDQGCVTGGPMPEYLRNKKLPLDEPQAPPAVAEAAVDDDGGEEPYREGEAVEYRIGDGIHWFKANYGSPENDHEFPHIVLLPDGRIRRLTHSEIRRPSPAPSDSAATAFLGDAPDPAHERAMAGEGVEL